jgi:hypothetical protein
VIKGLGRSCRDQLDELGPRGGERKRSDVLFFAQWMTLTLLLMLV